MKSFFENKRKNKRNYRFIDAYKKVFLFGAVTLLMLSSLLPLQVRALNTDAVTISVKVNKEVVSAPDLYEHLTLTMKTADNQAGTGAVLVLETKMDQIGNEPLPIGEFEFGRRIYVFFDITMDGASTPNDFQGSNVRTSYEFSAQSEKGLEYFKIRSQTGDAFENMINLNPGDKKTGVAVIDIGNASTVTTNRPETTTKKDVPGTNDTAPIGLLVALSGAFAALLIVQMVFLKRAKSKTKEEAGS